MPLPGHSCTRHKLEMAGNSNVLCSIFLFPRCTASTTVMRYLNLKFSNSQILSVIVCKGASLLDAHVLFSYLKYVSAHMSNDESETFGRRSDFCPAPTSIQYQDRFR